MSLRQVSPSRRGTQLPRRLGRRFRSRYDLKQCLWAVAFVLPLMAGITLFYLWPIVRTVQTSFTRTGIFGGETFVGSENYVNLIKNGEFWQSLLNTAIYTAALIAAIPIAVVLAVMLRAVGLRMARIYRVLLVLPYLAMPVAISIVWRVILNGNFGILNSILGPLGIPTAAWLSTRGLALAAVALVGIWTFVGFNVIILGAGLEAIPQDVYEAGAIDGAGPVRRFFSITVPLLTPTTFFLLAITVINGFQLFDLIYVLIGPSNPALGSTQSLVYLFYQESFNLGAKGYGAAIAVLTLSIVLVFTALQFRVQRKWVNYA